MHLKLLADESLDFRIVLHLRKSGFDVISVMEDNPGISDKEVLNLAIKYNAILLTEDSDFGEWIFAHKEKTTGVVFFRYNSKEVNEIAKAITIIINKYGINLFGKFTVITSKKVRIREL